MKVYALLHYVFEDYSGGGGTIVAVFDSWDKAYARAVKDFPSIEKSRRWKEDDGSDRWELPTNPAMSEDCAIEEYEVE